MKTIEFSDIFLDYKSTKSIFKRLSVLKAFIGAGFPLR